MRYEAVLTNNFLRVVRKQPEEMKTRIREAMEGILVAPYSGTKLRGELAGGYRWRLGEYRIRYRIGEKPKSVIFLDFGPRKSIYD